MRHAPLSALCLLIACDSGEDRALLTPSTIATQPGDPAASLDLALTQGHAAADHTQVAPGVFMLTELYASGEITYLPADISLGADATEEELQAAIAMGAPRMPVSSAPYCYNYDNQYYNEDIGRGLFAGGATFYGYANAYSYNYGGTTQNTVYAGAYTYTRDAVDYAYAYAYVYIDDRYVGYVYQYTQNDTYAYAYGSWSARCGSDLTINATVYTNNYLYNADGSYANVGTTFQTSAACCL